MKKILSLCLVLATSVCLCMPVYAASFVDSTISDPFIQVCDLFFSGNGKAYNAAGIDVTDSFYASYVNAYSSGNYAAIKNGCVLSGISRIKVHNESSIQSRAEMSKTYEDAEYHLITHDGFPYNGKTWGFVVWAEGSITYHDSNFQITSYTIPTISYTFDGLGAAFSGSVTSDIPPTFSLINNRKTLTFTVCATHEVNAPIPGLQSSTVLGPFETESVFEISAQ